MPRTPHATLALVVAAAFVAAAVASLIGTESHALWISETIHILIAFAALTATYRRFQFTMVTYVILLVFSWVIFAGAHYSYALVPLGEWARALFGFTRNHFDRVGHFFQGAAPAMFVRELLIRRSGLRKGPSLFWIVAGLCLGMAAMFELAEWQWAVTKGGPVVDDLGAQGDPWDSQQDMLMALVGAIIAQLMLSKWQDRQIHAMR